MKDPVYAFDPWFDVFSYQPQVPVGLVLERLEIANNGVVPEDLDSEVLIHAFADTAAIPFADADVEPGLTFPNKAYASREWIRLTYMAFYEWCVKQEWIERPIATTTSLSHDRPRAQGKTKPTTPAPESHKEPAPV